MSSIEQFRKFSHHYSPPHTISLMYNRDFFRALSYNETEPTTNEHLFNLIFSLSNCEHAVIAACFIKLGALEYLEHLMNNLYSFDLTPEQKLNFEHLISSFFLLDLFPILYTFLPTSIPQLLEFQKRYFHYKRIRFNTSTDGSFRKFFYLAQKNNNIDSIIDTLTSYIFFIHENTKHIFTNNDFCNSYTNIITVILLNSRHNPILLNKLAKLPSELTHEQLFLFYNHLTGYFRNIPLGEFSFFYPCMLIIFSNPLLCSLAFRENNLRFLQFCNVTKSIKKSPHLFI